MAKKLQQLEVVPLPPVTYLEPPRPLGLHGAQLWRSVVSQFKFGDPAAIETLAQACASLDRAESCAAEIAHDGQTIETKGIIRQHPLITAELSARGLCCRLLARLGLDLVPLHPTSGRPPGR